MRVKPMQVAAIALGYLQGSYGLLLDKGKIPPMGLTAAEQATLRDRAAPLVGSGTFLQPIDHKDPSKGTFSTSYWYNATSWGGPGSPVGSIVL